MRLTGVLVAALIGLTMTAPPAAHAQPESSAGKRVALVIGNSSYTSPILPKLANPVNDADDIAAALKGFGFQVIVKKNLSKQGMEDALAEFGRAASNADTALFYFSGHGIQAKNQNYLLPIDAQIKDEASVQYQSVNVNLALDEMDEAHSKVNLVFLDACRDNNLSGVFRSAATRGLAQPGSVPRGTVIVYATDPGNVASDGTGRNGLFTGGLLHALKGPDLSLHKVLVSTSTEVVEASHNTQTPYINGPVTVQDSFYFAPGSNVTVVTPGATVPASDAEIIFWNSIANSTSPADYQAYLDQYPKGRFATLAKARAHPQVAALTPAPASSPPPAAAPVPLDPDPEVVFWQSISGSTNPSDYQAYLDQYPKGRYVSLAKSRALPQVATATPAPAAPTPSTPGPIACSGGTLASLSNAGVGTCFKDCADGCPEMMVIPAGSFTMGTPASEQGRYASEGPQHSVTIGRAFAAGRYDVTFAQWDACVLAGGCNGHTPADQGWGRGSRPVIMVSWEDANAYTRWLSQRTGQTYRLLSESEWEYAARAGTSSAYFWGDSVGRGNANCDGCGSQWDHRQTSPVGSFSANRFGLYDMAGNVWQWTEDCWNENYSGAPSNEGAWTSENCGLRVLRGGAWTNSPGGLRAGLRNRYSPGDHSSSGIGFRVARTLTP